MRLPREDSRLARLRAPQVRAGCSRCPACLPTALSSSLPPSLASYCSPSPPLSYDCPLSLPSPLIALPAFRYPLTALSLPLSSDCSLPFFSSLPPSYLPPSHLSVALPPSPSLLSSCSLPLFSLRSDCSRSIPPSPLIVLSPSFSLPSDCSLPHPPSRPPALPSEPRNCFATLPGGLSLPF